MGEQDTIRIQANGKPLTDRDVQRGLRLNIMAGCMGNVWGTIIGGMPLTMFMKSIGASGVLIGLAATVGQVAMALQVVSALLAERLTSRKHLFGWTLIPHRLLWFLPAVLPLVLAPHSSLLAPAIIWTVAMSGLLGQLGSASWWSWMADLVPESQRAAFWGRRLSIISITCLLGFLAVGWLLDIFPDPAKPGGSFLGFSLVFALAACLGTADIICHLWVPEPKPVLSPVRSGVLSLIMKPFANRDFLWLTLGMGVWTFASGVTGQFSLVYLSRDLNVSYSGMSILAASAMVGGVLAGVMWGYVMDRVGARNFGSIMMLLAPLLHLFWFFLREGAVSVNLPFLPYFQVSQIMLMLTISSFFAGLVFSGVALAQLSLLPALSPVEGRTMAMAAHWSVVGLIGSLGPLLGGILMDRIHDGLQASSAHWTIPSGLPLSFFHILLAINAVIIWLVGLRCMLAIKHREGEMGFGTALATLSFANPIRAFSGIYNIYSMLSTSDRANRVDAVRRVGEDKLRIAVRDLIQQLDDPATDVREAAALALGRIGSPDAVDALVGKLDDPNADLAPQIARALRHTHSRQAVDSLIRRLNDPDRETVTETVRTLGDIGDDRAKRPLLDILRRSQDSKVISASSEALARLGEMSALYEIIPRMKAATNPVLKRSLAVAAGDLLGKPGEFYGIMIREQREPGSEIERLIRQIQGAIEQVRSGELESQGHKIKIMAGQVSEHILAGRLKESVGGLFELAVGLAALRYGVEFGRDTEAFVETMIWNDVRFGLSAWCIELLQEPDAQGVVNEPDRTDVLLGVYLLSLWSLTSVKK